MPDATTLRIAVMGASHHRLSWFDALMWAYAEQAEVPTLYSEDFTHGARYGTVQVIDPFRDEPVSGS